MKKPGALSPGLIEALNIPPLAPPPWLINMQRYGPPPSYPNLRIPGLNAPIPEGAVWGYHPGGWGKPPVDENMRPLYGDVFGVFGNATTAATDEVKIFFFLILSIFPFYFFLCNLFTNFKFKFN